MLPQELYEYQEQSNQATGNTAEPSQIWGDFPIW